MTWTDDPKLNHHPEWEGYENHGARVAGILKDCLLYGLTVYEYGVGGGAVLGAIEATCMPVKLYGSDINAANIEATQAAVPGFTAAVPERADVALCVQVFQHCTVAETRSVLSHLADVAPRALVSFRLGPHRERDPKCTDLGSDAAMTTWWWPEFRALLPDYGWVGEPVQKVAPDLYVWLRRA